MLSLNVQYNFEINIDATPDPRHLSWRFAWGQAKVQLGGILLTVLKY